jgi:hypothetical protein
MLSDHHKVSDVFTFGSIQDEKRGLSISFRRPNMVPYYRWMNNCVEFPKTSTNAVASDRILIKRVRLLVIAQEASISLSFDDLGNMPSLYEYRVQLILMNLPKKRMLQTPQPRF